MVDAQFGATHFALIILRCHCRKARATRITVRFLKKAWLYVFNYSNVFKMTRTFWRLEIIIYVLNFDIV